MSGQADLFRDFGIHPSQVASPADRVRADLSSGQIVGQLIGTGLMSALGIGMAVALAIGLFPEGLATAVLPLAGFGYVVYRITCNDYTWIELDGETIRAKHLYTRRLVERPIDEIADLLTLVYQVQTPETLIAEAWLGRIRGIMIRFGDQRTPLQVSRADPAMSNARELIEAIVWRMAQKGELGAEIINLEGKPMVRRIYWKRQSRTA